MSAIPTDLPVRSQSGKAALDVFYADFNDVNFYVEDEEQENLYCEILRKLFKGIRITRIFPLGGKTAVFEHAASEANQGITAYKAYIVDRDFDQLLEKEFQHPSVFYLDRFCIENHLLESEAVVEMVIENHPKRKRADIEDKLSLGEQIPNLYRCLRPLFVLFFCCQLLDLGVSNTSLPPEAFCEPKRLWELKDDAISGYGTKLQDTAGSRGVCAVLFKSQCDSAISLAKIASDHKLVSGKFVAAMLFHYIKSKYSLGSMTFESFAYRLAKNCTLRSMRPFARRVRSGIRCHRAASSALVREK
jgi:hypothetical protein